MRDRPTMKPPTPKPSDPQGPAAGDTQVIDLQDVQLLVAQQEHQRSLPPPLPPEVRASHVPPEPPEVHEAAFAPPSEAPAPRSTAFYAVALLVFLTIGVGGGVVVAMTLRKAPSAAPAPSAKPQAAVITIPTVEMDDDPDGGK